MLKWPDRARRSLATFFVKWNDFDVFVEDTAKFANAVYSSFITRVAQGNCKVSRVIPLGDRNKVLSTAAADSKKGGRRRLYLVDGDLDLISGIPDPIVDRLFVHKVYHLENYFLCEEALLEVLQEENPRLSTDNLRAALDYHGWLREVEPLLDLFVVFGMTRIVDPSMPTISIGIGAFSSNNRIDVGKIRCFCQTRTVDLEERCTAQQLKSAKRRVLEATRAHSHFTDLVSARDFLLPTLRWWIAGKNLKLPANKESLLFRLSKRCAIERHVALTDAIKKCSTARAA